MGLANHIRKLTQVPWQAKLMPEIKCSMEKHKISEEIKELLSKGAIVETVMSKKGFVP